MKSSLARRLFDLYGLLFVSSLPFFLLGILYLKGAAWAQFLYPFYSVLIIVFLTRSRFKEWLRSLFPSLSRYAIRCVLVASLLLSFFMIFGHVKTGESVFIDSVVLMTFFVIAILILIAKVGTIWGIGDR